MHNTDTLLHPRWVIPVDAKQSVLQHHSVAISDGRIVAVLPTEQARKIYQAGVELDLPGHALIPGLINTHTHAAMSLLRGLADDLPLMEWLEQHIWPAEQQWISEQFVHDGSQLAIAEMLRSGTTCFNDMYFFPEVTARVAANAGIRATVGLILLDFPTVYAENADQYLSKGLALHDTYKQHPLVQCAFAPHAPYTVSDAPLQRVRVLADELDIPVHIHLHETATELAQSLEQSGLRPLQRLKQLGLAEPGLLAVHMTQLTDEEIRELAEDGVQVLHCPESNLKLASGFCPVQSLLDAGVNVALGTDGAASNNDMDMLGEMRSAALLAKAVASDASALTAYEALQMATLNGARALNIADQTGSIETGKWADLCAIDLNTIETRPLYDPVSQIVYAAGREQVSNVWVAGQHLLKNRQLVNLDKDEILAKAQAWQARIAES